MHHDNELMLKQAIVRKNTGKYRKNNNTGKYREKILERWDPCFSN